MKMKMENGSEIEFVEGVVIDESAKAEEIAEAKRREIDAWERTGRFFRKPEKAEMHPGPRNRHERRAKASKKRGTR